MAAKAADKAWHYQISGFGKMIKYAHAFFIEFTEKNCPTKFLDKWQLILRIMHTAVTKIYTKYIYNRSKNN